ncbi:MAG TPA: 50S ribosomal protein L10, partial [Terriglobia bacterium]|nr:50S ribosomal protein L10 [Terriglobia bacterium]
MKKDAKQQKAEELRQELSSARAVILSSFEGMTVSQDFELRRKIESVGAKYRVTKNSIIERASQGTPGEAAMAKLYGTTSLAYTAADPVALAKAITAYAKENAVLVFKTGVIEGRVIALKDLTALATLPSRGELLSKALFLINSPAQRVAAVLSAVGRNLACVVQQGVQEKKFREASGQ